MKNYIQDIELVNQFIENKLKGDEKNNVLNRIEIDEVFKALYEEHLILLEGIKRTEIKYEINTIHNNYLKVKWFKYIGISLVTIGVIIISYLLLTDKKETVVRESLKPKTEITIPIKDTILSNTKSIDTIKISKESNRNLVKEPIKKSVKIDTSINVEILKTTSAESEILTLESLKKKSQDFIINVEKDTVLIGKEGTRLIIKANSFIDKDAVPVNGKINVKLTEYYKLSDILFENLSTTSDDKLLETGGMLFIETRQKDELLELRNKSEIDIEFPYKQEKKKMQLFLGEEREDFVNWQLGNQELKTVPIIEELRAQAIKETSRNTFVLIEKAPVYPGCENRLNEKASKCTADKIRAFVAENINTTLIEDLSLPRQRINAVFKIDKTGAVKNGYTSSQQPRLKAEIIRVLKQLPKMTPAKQRRRAIEVEYILPLILGEEDNVIDNRLPFVRDSVSVNGSEVIVRGYTTGASKLGSVVVNESEKVKRYTLRAPKLGWINCDRFVRSNKKKIKYKFKIKDTKGVDIKLIFKGISSVLPYKNQGGFYDFGTVPKGDAIKLIAIKTIGGKLYIDMIDTVIKTNPNIEFNFEEVTIKQLQKRIEELNNEF